MINSEEAVEFGRLFAGHSACTAFAYDVCYKIHCGLLSNISNFFMRAARIEKAKKTFPRPTAGPLRPIVHGQTIKYNSKKRLGRGFTLEELKVLPSRKRKTGL